MSIIQRIRQQAQHGAIDTYATVDGVEDQCVIVDYRIEPAEPDVGFYGGLDVEAVHLKDGTAVLGRMSDNELNELADRVRCELDDRGDPADDYGDWLHDCRRDDELTGDAV